MKSRWNEKTWATFSFNSRKNSENLEIGFREKSIKLLWFLRVCSLRLITVEELNIWSLVAQRTFKKFFSSRVSLFFNSFIQFFYFECFSSLNSVKIKKFWEGKNLNFFLQVNLPCFQSIFSVKNFQIFHFISHLKFPIPLFLIEKRDLLRFEFLSIRKSSLLNLAFEGGKFEIDFRFRKKSLKDSESWG